jgi:hypothetical protein
VVGDLVLSRGLRRPPGNRSAVLRLPAGVRRELASDQPRLDRPRAEAHVADRRPDVGAPGREVERRVDEAGQPAQPRHRRGLPQVPAEGLP